MNKYNTLQKIQQAYYFSELDKVVTRELFVEAFGTNGLQEYSFYKMDGCIVKYIATSFMGEERIGKLIELLEGKLNPKTKKLIAA